MGKPRNKILLKGLQETLPDLIECHREIWADVPDKSQVKGFLHRSRLLIRWVLAYPGLIVRYLLLPRHDVVFVGYMGHLDVIVLWLFAKLRGAAIAWDAYLSIYSTVVEDRRLVRPSNPLAYLLYAWEWIACRAADLVLLDTRAHADYFVDRYALPKKKTGAVFIGMEPSTFPPLDNNLSPRGTHRDFTIVFFGQFIALHGLKTIYEAARLARELPMRWLVIGGGQEEEMFECLLREDPVPGIQRLPFLPYAQFLPYVYGADVCLGIFGDSDKAARVIPNKVFQILNIGKPLITRDSPAIRELLQPDMEGLSLIPAADPQALYEAVRRMWQERDKLWGRRFHAGVAARIQPSQLGKCLVEEMAGLLAVQPEGWSN